MCVRRNHEDLHYSDWCLPVHISYGDSVSAKLTLSFTLNSCCEFELYGFVIVFVFNVQICFGFMALQKL